MVWVAIIGCIALAIMGLFYRPLDDDLSPDIPAGNAEARASLTSSSNIFGVLKSFGLFLGGFCIVISVTSFLFSSNFLSRNTVTERLSQSLVEQAQTLEENVIVIDGGSYAHRAIDGKALKRL